MYGHVSTGRQNGRDGRLDGKKDGRTDGNKTDGPGRGTPAADSHSRPPDIDANRYRNSAGFLTGIVYVQQQKATHTSKQNTKEKRTFPDQTSIQSRADHKPTKTASQTTKRPITDPMQTPPNHVRTPAYRPTTQLSTQP